MDDTSPPSSQQPKPKRKILAAVLSAVGLAITMAVYNECQREQLAQQGVERANTAVTVWMPGPGGYGLIPYSDVEILGRGSDYIRFRTRDGHIMEQHGSFRIEAERRSDYTDLAPRAAPAPTTPLSKFVILTVSTTVSSLQHGEIKLPAGTRLKMVGRDGRDIIFTLENDGEKYSLPDSIIKEE